MILDIIIQEIQDRFKKNYMNSLQAMKGVIESVISNLCETYKLDLAEVKFELINRMFKTQHNEFNI